MAVSDRFVELVLRLRENGNALGEWSGPVALALIVFSCAGLSQAQGERGPAPEVSQHLRMRPRTEKQLQLSPNPVNAASASTPSGGRGDDVVRGQGVWVLRQAVLPRRNMRGARLVAWKINASDPLSRLKLAETYRRVHWLLELVEAVKTPDFKGQFDQGQVWPGREQHLNPQSLSLTFDSIMGARPNAVTKSTYLSLKTGTAATGKANARAEFEITQLPEATSPQLRRELMGLMRTAGASGQPHFSLALKRWVDAGYEAANGKRWTAIPEREMWTALHYDRSVARMLDEMNARNDEPGEVAVQARQRLAAEGDQYPPLKIIFYDFHRDPAAQFSPSVLNQFEKAKAKAYQRLASQENAQAVVRDFIREAKLLQVYGGSLGLSEQALAESL